MLETMLISIDNLLSGKGGEGWVRNSHLMGCGFVFRINSSKCYEIVQDLIGVYTFPPMNHIIQIIKLAFTITSQFKTSPFRYFHYETPSPNYLLF